MRYCATAISAYDKNRLQHFGIKGQKWGIRRYQYENGSYTPEGIERYHPSRSTNKLWQKQSAKLEKYDRNADAGYQMRRAEIEKSLAKKNAVKGLADIGAMVGNKVTQDFVMPKMHRSMLAIANPSAYKINKIASTVNTLGLGGAGALRLASATAHGIKAINASRKVSEIGHNKALAKRDAQYKKMLKMFEGTPYADLLKEQAKLNR